MPFGDESLSPENAVYLSTEQVLADYAGLLFLSFIPPLFCSFFLFFFFIFFFFRIVDFLEGSE